jgi:hypothetical protein
MYLEKAIDYFIPIALLTLSLGTLNNPKTCRMIKACIYAEKIY